MQERRKTIRRQADAAILRRVEELESRTRQREEPRNEADRLRRRVIRHNCSVEIAVQIGFSSGTSDVWNVDTFKIRGRLLDLSPGGAALFTGQILDVGQELRLAIRLSDTGAAIDAKAAVRWVKAIPKKGGYAAGVQFTEVSSADQRKIADYLTELDATVGL